MWRRRFKAGNCLDRRHFPPGVLCLGLKVVRLFAGDMSTTAILIVFAACIAHDAVSGFHAFLSQRPQLGIILMRSTDS
jgi:uncharacterized membrane protein YbaN (DUF454 family)